MKIVINNCFGGFEVSENFFKAYNIPHHVRYGCAYPDEEIDLRRDPRLIEYIETHGSKMASGDCAELIVREIPKGTLYHITEYDGFESIETIESIGWLVAT